MSTNSSWQNTREPLRRWDEDSLEATLLARIGDSSPYFSLEDAEFDGAELRAQAETETDAGSEAGPASAAEIARHALVAAGGCLALARPDAARCHYLASSLEGSFFACNAAYGSRLSYAAIPTAEGPVGGAAKVEVHVDGDLCARLHTSFAIVEERLFARLFAAHRSVTFAETGGYEGYEPFGYLAYDDHAANARLAVTPSACRGHYQQYPALPASTMLGQLVRLAGLLAPGRFRVSAFRLQCQSVIWAGEELTLGVARQGATWNLAGHARVDGRPVASLELSLSMLPRGAAR